MDLRSSLEARVHCRDWRGPFPLELGQGREMMKSVSVCPLPGVAFLVMLPSASFCSSQWFSQQRIAHDIHILTALPEICGVTSASLLTYAEQVFTSPGE